VAPAATSCNNQINADGKFANHVPWNFKLTGGYSFPYDITLGASVIYRAGRTWTRVLRVPGLNQGSENIWIEPRGSQHFDPILYLDIRLEKVFRFDRYSVSFLADRPQHLRRNHLRPGSTRHPARSAFQLLIHT